MFSNPRIKNLNKFLSYFTLFLSGLFWQFFVGKSSVAITPFLWLPVRLWSSYRLNWKHFLIYGFPIFVIFGLISSFGMINSIRLVFLFLSFLDSFWFILHFFLFINFWFPKLPSFSKYFFLQTFLSLLILQVPDLIHMEARLF